MDNLIIIFILLLVLIAAIRYIVKTKKRGNACIGCPNASKCGSHCHCNESH